MVVKIENIIAFYEFMYISYFTDFFSMFVFHFSLFFSKMKWRAHIIIRGVNIFMLFYCFFVWSCVSLFF